jgi:hypothetical protein
MDDVAAFVIVRIVVVVVIGGEANSDERAPTKAVMKLMEAASVERKTVKASSVETAAMEAAKATVETATATVEAATTTVEAATTTVETATAAAAVTAAMSRRHVWLNQPDRRQRQQSQYQFPRHASLLHCPRPRVWDTDAIGIFGDDEVSTVN